MNDYISRDAIVKWVEKTYCKPCEKEKRDYNHCRCGACQYDDMILEISSFPAADVRPVVRGHWVKVGGYVTLGGDPVWCCSECGKGLHVFGVEHDTYGRDVTDGQWVSCPNCGADMRKEEADGNV